MHHKFYQNVKLQYDLRVLEVTKSYLLSQIHVFGFLVIFVILVVFCLMLGPFRCYVVVLLLYLMRFPRF